MLVAIAFDPASASEGRSGVVGDWPAGIVVAGDAFGTTRAAANAALGSPDAVLGKDGSQAVVCAQARGRFSSNYATHPPGAPEHIFAYAVVCFDPASGQVMDWGYSDESVTEAFRSSVRLDVTTPITRIAG